MIETKEEYEELRVFYGNTRKERAIWETIEALRKVARATARFGGRMGQSIGIGAPNNMRRIDFTNEEWAEFQKALDALPDWITEPEHE